MIPKQPTLSVAKRDLRAVVLEGIHASASGALLQGGNPCSR